MAALGIRVYTVLDAAAGSPCDKTFRAKAALALSSPPAGSTARD